MKIGDTCPVENITYTPGGDGGDEDFFKAYSSGSWTCCDETVCRVCSEFGQDPTNFYP